MKNLKPALTFTELIIKLKDRGLTISQTDKIKNLNYYFIRGYAEYGGLTTPKPNNEYVFISGLTFDDLYNIYIFDTQLKSVILNMVGLIEKSLKTNLANVLSTYQKIYTPFNSKQQHKISLGALCYLDPIIYRKKSSYKSAVKLLNYLTNSLKTRVKQNQIVKHHAQKYSGFYPAWVLFNYFQWGEMIDYIQLLDTPVYNKLFSSLGIRPIRCEHLVAYLHLIRHLRNVCSHFDRLYAWNFYYQMPKSLNIATLYHTLFYVLSIMRSFCSTLPLKEEWNIFVDKMNILISDPHLKYIDISKMGLPANWFIILKIK